MFYAKPTRVTEIKIRFVLRTNHTLQNGDHPILLRLQYQGQKKEIATGQSSPRQHWLTESGSVAGKYKLAYQINRELDEIQYKVRQLFEKMKSTIGDFSLDELVHRLLGHEEAPLTLMEYVDGRIKAYDERVGVDLAVTTFYKYKRTQKYLQEFLEKKHHLKNIPLTRVNVDFLEAFFKFLRKEKNNSHNSSLALMNCLKSILHDPVKKGVIRANPFSEMALTQKPVQRDYLVMDEIKALQELTGLTESLERNRDIFLFACYTGLSYSDLLTLKRHHIIVDPDGTKHIEKHREKTGVMSYVPLLPAAEKILLKYSPTKDCRDFQWKICSNQKLNASLKVIAIQAKISKTLFMHLARHTFATTVTLSNGVPLESVGKMIGHSGMKNLMIYAKIVNTKVKNDMERIRNLF